MSETRILELRTQRGWTQERLAEVSGVTVRTLQRLEAGNDVSLDTLSRLGKALGVPVRDLFMEAPESEYGKAVSALSETEARSFSDAARIAWRHIALAVALFVTSPIPVVLLIAGADAGVIPTSVEVAIAIGLGALFLVAAAGAVHLVRASSTFSPFPLIRQKRLSSSFGAQQWAESLEETNGRQRGTSLAVAVGLWLISPLPVIVAALLEPSQWQGLWIAGGVTFFLLVVAAGTFAVLQAAWSRYAAEKLTASAHSALPSGRSPN